MFKKIVLIFHTSAFKIGMLLTLFLTSAVIIIAILLGNEAGSFVIRVQNTDTDRSIALTESMDKEKYKLLPRLNASSKDNMTDCSPRYFLDQDYKTIRETFYKVDGLYNEDYLKESVYAYTFYLVNDGRTSVGVDMKMTCSNITRQLDEIIRVMTYYEYNGTQVAHIYQKKDTIPATYDHYNVGTVENFNSTSEIFNINGNDKLILSNADGNNYVKFLVIMWLEGDDPDSDRLGKELYGGSMSFNLDFTVDMGV